MKKVLLCTSLIAFAIGLFFSCSSDDTLEFELPKIYNSPKVYLNHVNMVLDEQTYNDILNSEFLKTEFADLITNTATADDMETWSGIYITGETTYMEIFKEGDRKDYSRGCCAMGLSTEEPGEIDNIFVNIRENLNPNVKKVLRKRKLESTEIPWFYCLKCDGNEEKGKLNTTVIEYHEDYLKELMAGSDYPTSGISRKIYNNRYYKYSRLMNNITEITIAMDDDKVEDFCREMALFGYEINKKNGIINCKGPEILFKIVEQNDECKGITSLKFKLNDNKYGQQEYKFGPESVLKFNDDKTAVWTF